MNISLLYSFTYFSNSDLESFRAFINNNDVKTKIVTKNNMIQSNLGEIFVGKILCVDCSNIKGATDVIEIIKSKFSNLNLLLIITGTLTLSPEQFDIYKKTMVSNKNNYIISYYFTQCLFFIKKKYIIYRYFLYKDIFNKNNNKYYY